ncbi:MAG: hypothetical protein ABFS34_04905 [Gemmatimonadota bacterium]
MEIFEYVSVLTSIIIGLGLAHLLRGVAHIIQHPGRERVYWIHLLWVAFTFFSLIFWWWWEFRLGEVEVWRFEIYAFVVLYAVVMYMLCAMLFPSDLSDHDGFKGYFHSVQGWFFGLLIASLLIDLVDTLIKGTDYFRSQGIEYPVTTAVFFALFLAAAFSRSERYHAVVVVLAFFYRASLAVRLFGTMG